MNYKYNYFSRDRFWTRYTLDNPTDQVFVIDNKDESPVYPHWQHGKYSSECAACWLGITHSTNYHNQDKGDRNRIA